MITISEEVECSRKISANLMLRLLFSLLAKSSASSMFTLSVMVLNSSLMASPAFFVTSGMTITSEQSILNLARRLAMLKKQKIGREFSTQTKKFKKKKSYLRVSLSSSSLRLARENTRKEQSENWALVVRMYGSNRVKPPSS